MIKIGQLFKIEKNTAKFWIAAIVLFLTAIYMLDVFFDISVSAGAVIGIVIGTFIIVENGIMMWFQKSTYRKFDFRDIVGIGSLLVGGAVLLHSFIMLFNIELMQGALRSFFRTNALLLGTAIIIFALLHMFIRTKK